MLRRRSIAPTIGAVVALAVLAGCGADDPTVLELPPGGAGDAVEATEPPALTVAPVPTDAAGTTPLNAVEVPALNGVAPQVGEANRLGSGCAPGDTDTLPDGLWAAIITERGATMTTDLVCFFADGTTDNSSGTLRTNATSSALRTFTLDGTGGPAPADATQWLALPPTASVYWIAVTGGTVTSVQEVIAG